MTVEKVFIEQQIIDAIWKLLLGRVNELLGDMQYNIPSIESGECGGNSIIPVIALVSCERTEKERIIFFDTYSLSIIFSLQETPESELFCYAYAASVCKVLQENPTLGGIADRAVITGKKYVPPKKPYCGEGWGLAITVRITVEGMAV